MVEFMKCYYLEKVLLLRYSLQHIYDDRSYFYLVEKMENIGIEYDGTIALITMLDRKEMEDAPCSAIEFLASRYLFYYRNMMMMIVCKLSRMGVFGFVEPKENSIFYNMLLPELDNLYEIAGVEKDNLDLVLTAHANIVRKVFQAAEWQMMDGVIIVDDDTEWIGVTRIIMEQLAEITPFVDTSLTLGEVFSEEELSEYIECEAHQKDAYLELGYVVFTKNCMHSYEALSYIFQDFMPSSLSAYLNIDGHTVVVCVYVKYFCERSLVIEVNEGCYSMFSALAAYLLHLWNPNLLLPQEVQI